MCFWRWCDEYYEQERIKHEEKIASQQILEMNFKVDQELLDKNFIFGNNPGVIYKDILYCLRNYTKIVIDKSAFAPRIYMYTGGSNYINTDSFLGTVYDKDTLCFKTVAETTVYYDMIIKALHSGHEKI